MGINPKPKTFRACGNCIEEPFMCFYRCINQPLGNVIFLYSCFTIQLFGPSLLSDHPFKSLLKLKSSISLYEQNMGACNHDWKLMGQPSFSCLSTLHMAHDLGWLNYYFVGLPVQKITAIHIHVIDLIKGSCSPANNVMW